MEFSVAYSTVAQKAQTQINFPKHKSISQNANMFSKTQINFPKHKSISQNTNQFQKTGHYIIMNEMAWKAEWRTRAQGLSHPIRRLSERAVFSLLSYFEKIAHMSVVWAYESLWLCIFVTLYLCIFVSLYLCIFVSLYLCIFVSL